MRPVQSPCRRKQGATESDMKNATYYEQRAEQLFREGYNCAQSAFITFAEEQMGRDEAARLASALGGGLAGMRMTCGALSGIAMAYGMLRGYSDPAAKDQKLAEYTAVHEMADEFERRNGSLLCRELLGLDAAVKYVPPSERSAEYYEKRPCPRLCACAAGILAGYLQTHPAEDKSPAAP